MRTDRQRSQTEYAQYSKRFNLQSIVEKLPSAAPQFLEDFDLLKPYHFGNKDLNSPSGVEHIIIPAPQYSHRLNLAELAFLLVPPLKFSSAQSDIVAKYLNTLYENEELLINTVFWEHKAAPLRFSRGLALGAVSPSPKISRVSTCILRSHQ